ncbi:MAG: hypothetical protein V1774_10970 [Candidatus Eisenbacteria bacterium]
MSASAGRSGNDGRAARAVRCSILFFLFSLPAVTFGQITVPLSTARVPREAHWVGEWTWTRGETRLVPIALDVHPSGEIWGIEGRAHQLFRADSDGNDVRVVGGGEGIGQLDLATRVFARSGLKVFTLDPWGAVLDCYDLNGLREQRVELGTRIEEAGESLGEAIDFCLDPGGDIFLLDGRRECIFRFDGSARLLQVFGEADAAELRTPAAIDVDGFGRIFVLTTRPAGLGMLEPAGKRWHWKPLAGAAGETVTPGCLAVDPWGNAFVGDPVAGGVWVFSQPALDGWFFTLPEDRLQPVDLAWDAAGRLLVADAARSRACVFGMNYAGQDLPNDPARTGD